MILLTSSRYLEGATRKESRSKAQFTLIIYFPTLQLCQNIKLRLHIYLLPKLRMNSINFNNHLHYSIHQLLPKIFIPSNNWRAIVRLVFRFFPRILRLEFFQTYKIVCVSNLNTATPRIIATSHLFFQIQVQQT